LDRGEETKARVGGGLLFRILFFDKFEVTDVVVSVELQTHDLLSAKVCHVTDEADNVSGEEHLFRIRVRAVLTDAVVDAVGD